MSQIPTRPVLRYHGGKWRIAPRILEFMPKHENYYEPFGGAASILIQKPVAKIEVYNDLDSAVVDLFQVLRSKRSRERLIDLLQHTPFSREEFLRCMTGIPTKNRVERVRRMIVVSFQSIGAKSSRQKGGWRTRTARSIWSPTSTWNTYPESLRAVSTRMKDVILENCHHDKFFDLYNREEVRGSGQQLWLLDPPYPADTRVTGYRKVYDYELTTAEHEALCHRARDLRGYVALCSYPNDLYNGILTGWTRIELKSRAQMNMPRVEAVYLNPALVEDLPNRHLLPECIQL